MRSLASDSLALFLSTMFVGLVSYFVFFVASRTLTADAASTFLTLWALTNTVLLALTIPADTYSPRFKLECDRAGLNDGDRLHLISAYSVLAGAAVAIVPFVIMAWGLLNIDLAGAAAIALFGIASSYFASRRAYLTANGEFGRYMIQTACFASVGMAGLLAVWVFDADHQAWLYLVLAGANFVAAATIIGRRAVPKRSHRPLRAYRAFLRTVRAGHTLSSLTVVTLIAVALSNGSLIFAKLLGVASKDIVAYAAAVNIVLIPFTVLNSFTSPIHNQFVRSIAEGERQEIWHDFLKAAARYLLVTTAVAGASLALLGQVVGYYAGHGYSLSKIGCLGVALGEGLATVTGLPRTLLVALGETRRVTPTWLVGLALFGGTLLLPIDPLARLILAPGVAAAGILILAIVQIHTVLWRRPTTVLGSLEAL